MNAAPTAVAPRPNLAVRARQAFSSLPVLDIDEVVAFVAPKLERSAQRPCLWASEQAGRATNWLAGKPLASAAQMQRGGQLAAAGLSRAFIFGGIFYAVEASRSAWSNAGHNRAEAPLWRAAQQDTRLSQACRAQARQAQFDGHCMLWANRAACVAAAGMAATLLLLPEVLGLVGLQWAGASGVAMGIAVPLMAAYGIVSAALAAATLWRGVAAGALNGQAPAPQRRNLGWQALMAASGTSLAVGLLLQFSMPALGLSMLSGGSICLEYSRGRSQRLARDVLPAADHAVLAAHHPQLWQRLA